MFIQRLQCSLEAKARSISIGSCPFENAALLRGTVHLQGVACGILEGSNACISVQALNHGSEIVKQYANSKYKPL